MGKLSDLLSTDRYKTWARQASGSPISRTGSRDAAPWDEVDDHDHDHDHDHAVLPTVNPDASTAAATNPGNSGSFNEKVTEQTSRSGSTASPKQYSNGPPPTQPNYPPTGQLDGSAHAAVSQPSTTNRAVDAISTVAPPPAPPPVKSEAEGPPATPVEFPDGDGGSSTAATAAAAGKRPIGTRMRDGSKRFVIHVKEALFHSWVNVLLVFVPIGIAVDAVGLAPGIVFGMNAVAIIPLAGMLAFATEAVASRLGDTWGALLNVSFGNAVEFIIFIIALVKNEISIVQAALLGSILANLLLILGMAFLLGGLRYQEQLYNNTVTQMSACLLSLSVVSLLLPTAFHASFRFDSSAIADTQVLKVSRGTSVVLLFVYILYLVFQLKSHAYLYESTPQEVIDEESHPGVFADIMNSSSSSDSSSSDDSTDTDASGSVYAAGKRIKRAFKNRRRRKSSASTSSATASAGASAISSSSIAERHGSYFDNAVIDGSKSKIKHGSTTYGGAEGDDADTEGDHLPRIRDFVKQQVPGTDAQAQELKKKRRKKHHKKSRHTAGKRANSGGATNVLDGQTVHSPLEMSSQPREDNKVNFSEDVETIGQSSISPARAAFNKRPFGRGSNLRPALPKMLSQNVFVSQPPMPTPAPRPEMSRSQPSRSIRRTNSLPDRLNTQASHPVARPTYTRNDTVPPLYHQAALQEIASHDQSEGDEDKPAMSRTTAVVLLLISTALVAICAEFMVDAIPAMLESSNVSQAFIGLIVLPIVSNAAEHVTAVTVAAKNKMDLAIGVAVGSSIQIALLVTPLVVLLGWILGRDMSLYFNLFDTISLFVTAFVVNFLVLDGRSNYLEGSLLIAAYVIIALGAFFYPTSTQASSFGGGERG